MAPVVKGSEYFDNQLAQNDLVTRATHVFSVAPFQLGVSFERIEAARDAENLPLDTSLLPFMDSRSDAAMAVTTLAMVPCSRHCS